MAKKAFRKARKALVTGEPPCLPAAVSAVEEPVRNNPPAGPGEVVAQATRAVIPLVDATPAQEPPHLLTPLAALWPTATPPEAPKLPATAPTGRKAPASAAPQSIDVTFVLPDLGARQVSLSGDFNGWSPDTASMTRDDAGVWKTTLALAPGRYQYKFVVDGQWVPDPQAHEQVWNDHGTLNSVIEVRG